MSSLLPLLRKSAATTTRRLTQYHNNRNCSLIIPTTRCHSSADRRRSTTTTKTTAIIRPNERPVARPKMTTPSQFSTAVRWEDDDYGYEDYDGGDYDENKECQDIQNSKTDKTIHCETCTCGAKDNNTTTNITTTEEFVSAPYPCGSPKHEDDFDMLPPPLPEPKYSVHKRLLPDTLTSLSSPEGRSRLLEALTSNTGESYWSLTEQFVSQSDPAYCGITTLMMCLNAFCIDPQIRWRGGWRFYGDEQVLLDRCCLSNERIKRVGVTLEEFKMLGQCNGLQINLKRPQQNDHPAMQSKEIYTLDDFRNDIQTILMKDDDCTDENQEKLEHHHHNHNNAILVVSFSRSSLGQTGDGHFSPIAAYHEPTDSVLVLDVARFKYAPYWASVSDLYESMKEKDTATGRTRGWFVTRPPKGHACHDGIAYEDRRPAELVPLVGDADACPVGKIKVDYCQVNHANI